MAQGDCAAEATAESALNGLTDGVSLTHKLRRMAHSLRLTKFRRIFLQFVPLSDYYSRKFMDDDAHNDEKWLFAALTALVMILVLWAYSASRTKPNPLMTAAVRGDIENVIAATGKMDAIERVNVGAQVSGQVKSCISKPATTCVRAS